MKNFLFEHATVVALAIIATVLALVFGFRLGLSEMSLAVLILSLISSGLALLVYSLAKQIRDDAKQVRGARLVADRLQAMMAAAPGGYALFSPQGLLRDTARLTGLLGAEAITHLDDIITTLSEPAGFVEKFRNLQQTGEEFAVAVHATKTQQRLQISGTRFKIGRDSLPMDLVWFTPLASSLEISIPLEVVGDGSNIAGQAFSHGFAELLGFPVWARDADTKLVACNTAYAKALDSTAEAVIQDQLEFVPDNTRGGGGRILATQVLQSGLTQKSRRHAIIAGKRRLFEITEIPARSKDTINTTGKAALYGFALDVTAEEEKQTELERHRASESEVLENLGSAIAIYGPDMRLEFFNRAYLRLWGAEEAFLTSKPTFGEILEDARARRRAPEQADFQRYKKERIALFTSLLEPREDLMHLPDGTSLRILAIPHPMGGIMFVHEDVTDKLAMESSYNTLIAVQRETLDNLAEGIGVFGQDGKLRLYNPAFSRIWKLQADYLDSTPHIAELLEAIKPLFNYGDHWPQFKNEMVEYTLDRSPRRGRIERADGAVIEYNTVPLPDGAALNSYLDVTDSVKVEQALRASNAALATADRLKSEFVANVSYQLRTPLNTIMGFAEILTNQYFGTLNERQVEYTRTIMDASKKLLLLINDVLDLATIEAGRMVLERRQILVADLLNAVKLMSIEWARQQMLDIMIDCPSDTGSFDVDEQRIKQALFNLVSNAIKYTPAGGRITLEARKAETGVYVAVIDTGIGIPEEDLARVFGKFERTNMQARQNGVGLGLSLVKSFIELHGGTIQISSKIGKGTRVECFLPHVGNAAPKAIVP